MAKKVFIGVGHGGSDPGAVADGLKEKDINLAVALACRDELERHDVLVLMSRTVDEDDRLGEEIRECNAFSPDLAMDVHNNAGGGDGAEVFYGTSGKGKPAAENILEEIKKIGQNSRGAKTWVNAKGQNYLGFIRETLAPAILVECAFLDNKKDVQIIDTPQEQKQFGVAIAKGILKTLDIAWKEDAKPDSAEGSDVVYRVQVGAYYVKSNAEAMLEKLKAAGFTDAYIR